MKKEYYYTRKKTKGRRPKYHIRREGTKEAIGRSFFEAEAKMIVDALNANAKKPVPAYSAKRNYPVSSIGHSLFMQNSTHKIVSHIPEQANEYLTDFVPKTDNKPPVPIITADHLLVVRCDVCGNILTNIDTETGLLICDMCGILHE